MRTYRVHLYREMRCTFTVQASSPQEAFKIADDAPPKTADCIEDCEAATSYAIIDPILLNGEVDYDHIIHIEQNLVGKP